MPPILATREQVPTAWFLETIIYLFRGKKDARGKVENQDFKDQ